VLADRWIDRCGSGWLSQGRVCLLSDFVHMRSQLRLFLLCALRPGSRPTAAMPLCEFARAASLRCSLAIRMTKECSGRSSACSMRARGQRLQCVSRRAGTTSEWQAEERATEALATGTAGDEGFVFLHEQHRGRHRQLRTVHEQHDRGTHANGPPSRTSRTWLCRPCSSRTPACANKRVESCEIDPCVRNSDEQKKQ